jgi:hypothetical protein
LIIFTLQLFDNLFVPSQQAQRQKALTDMTDQLRDMNWDYASLLADTDALKELVLVASGE